MRILSVATLISPEGEYGGPVRVALNQASALIDAGHSVTVIAGTRGFGDKKPSEVSGVPVRLFPVRPGIPGTGFAGLSARGMLRWINQNVAAYDIVHIHVARDLVTLPVAMLLRRRDVPYVLQTHGMIDASMKPLAALIDLAMTRPVLRSARAVFHLTKKERRDLTGVAGDSIRLRPLANGVPTPSATLSGPRPLQVLFLARLAPRKRPLHFVRMAASMLERHPHARFALVGPDEGEGSAVEQLISESGSDQLKWEGPLGPAETIKRMTHAGIYVLPAIDEPYPMSVLEAMSIGLPVIITETCGLAEVVRRSGCGIVVDHSQKSLDRAVDQLLRNPVAAARMGDAGAKAAREQFRMSTIADQLITVYQAP